MRGIVWFREDLRTHDNTALHHASQHCDDGVIAIFILDQAMWKKHDMAACRVDFIIRGLHELNSSLANLNIPLLIEHHHTTPIPEIIAKIADEHQAQSLFYNRQYEINEARRDQAVNGYLKARSIKVYSFDDQVILPPGKIVNLQGNSYKVYTAYKNAWYRTFSAEKNIKILRSPTPQNTLSIKSSLIPKKLDDFPSEIDSSLWPAGEEVAKRNLKRFITNHVFTYDKERDIPSSNGTSKLSPYLSTGMISPRQCFLAALSANQNELNSGNLGATTWMNELIWREFYKHILVAVPHVCMHKPYQLDTEKIKWKFNQQQLLAWQTGMTGYPIIDAAMRQLNQTGWMHNRLRMITAMFFAKNLFFDWRIGEKYFMQHLIDGDLAANNGGWQWCASTGTDAAPYFRVFNPVTQSERFDPSGDFIREYCPELSDVDNKAIHDPHARNSSLAKKLKYPFPIVDLSLSRQHAIQEFKKLA